jgi:S1-C subfamily serine protease
VVGTVAVVIAALVGAGIGRGFATHTTTYLPAQASPGGSGLPGSLFPGSSGSSGSSGSTGSSGSSGDGGSGVSAQASAIATKVDPGVVDIDTKLGYEEAEAAGTGMILTSSGEILTNNHVINGATEITATVVTTGKTYRAKVVGYDQTQDIAVLQLDGASGLPVIKTGDSSAVTPGASVVAIGNAGGVGGSPSVVTGTIDATNQSITASDEGGGNAEQLSGLLETNAPIQAGDSGGPLVNSSAEVIGMDTAASAGTRFAAQDSVGFAIPINQALSIAHQIVAGQASDTIHLGSTGFLGVSVADASSQGSAGSFGFGSGSGGSASNPSATSGALIEGVESGTPAATIGLATNDVITSVDGRTITSARSLTTAMQAYHPGDKVTVGWTDDSGQSHTASATLTTGPAA